MCMYAYVCVCMRMYEYIDNVCNDLCELDIYYVLFRK